MDYIKRSLNLSLPDGQSVFLWGPRKTGKSTLLKRQFPDSITYDFLKTDLFLELSTRPELLRQQLLAQSEEKLSRPIVLDEVQKIPHILDEVHWLIENKRLRFILCGSSARKLKKNHANLLGGRAWRFELFPLTSYELREVDLLKVLNAGLIPSHYLGERAERSLRGYTQDYLKEEIFDEALVRKVPAFSRFFEAAAFSHGQLVNYSNIARDCGIDSKTVKEYYNILTDTLVGILLPPFKKQQNRQVITKSPRFYFFDTGVANSFLRRNIQYTKGEDFGRAFEHFILMELRAHQSYSELNYPISFWRTKAGLEVDFILNQEIAIEVKGSSQVSQRDLKGLRVFHEEFKPRKTIVVSCEQTKRKSDGILFLPWREFLEELWAGNIIH